MKKMVQIETTMCDFCEGDDNTFCRPCMGCGRDLCFDCLSESEPARAHGKCFSNNVYCSTRSAAFCFTCLAVIEMPLLTAFRRVEALSAEHKAWCANFDKRQEAATAAVNALLAVNTLGR